MDMRIPPPRIKITLESNPLKSTMLVGRLGIDPTPNHYICNVKLDLLNVTSRSMLNAHESVFDSVRILEGTRGVPRNGGRKEQPV